MITFLVSPGKVKMRAFPLLVLSTWAWALSQTVLAQTARGENPGCFEVHLREAMHSNEQRRPLYSALTQGASIPITEKFIWMGEFSIPIAQFLQEHAQKYQDHGIPLLCDEVVSMSLTPPFREYSDITPLPLSQFQAESPFEILTTIQGAWNSDGFRGVAREAKKVRQRIASTPMYHCLLRHIMESIERAANLAPLYELQARQKGLLPPTQISQLFIELQLLSVFTVTEIDSRAAPIQARGIPIVCQDVPPIDPLNHPKTGPKTSAAHNNSLQTSPATLGPPSWRDSLHEFNLDHVLNGFSSSLGPLERNITPLLGGWSCPRQSVSL